MIRVLQILALALLLSLPQSHTGHHTPDTDRSDLSAFHLDPLHWRETLIFPRWEDRYAVVFEQEMLA